jgi:hypothetical protein
MCAARGRRLCSELEWERACKGPKNLRYEYGDRFDAKKCSTALGTVQNAGPVGALEGCKSAFGVSAMHGFGFEWTASAWGRGMPGDLAALRGGFGNQPFAHLRCTAAKSSSPDTKDKSVGFRCCGGPENGAKVEIANDERPVLEPIEALDAALQARMLGALKHGGLKASGGDVAIEKAWRWHPVRGEELLLAKVIDNAKTEGAKVTPAIILLCERISQLSNKLKGPVEEMGNPEAKTEPVRGSDPNDQRALLVFSVKTGENSGQVRLEYQFGQVAVTAPPWITSSAPDAK